MWTTTGEGLVQNVGLWQSSLSSLSLNSKFLLSARFVPVKPSHEDGSSGPELPISQQYGLKKVTSDLRTCHFFTCRMRPILVLLPPSVIAWGERHKVGEPSDT